MKTIKYSTNMVFKLEYDYVNKLIKVNDHIMRGDFVFVFSKYNHFMKYKPPCKECLICNMCITEMAAGNSPYEDDDYLYIQICEKLKMFLSDNKLFCSRGI